MVLWNSCEILDILTLHEYANMMLNIGIIYGFHVCCVVNLL